MKGADCVSPFFLRLKQFSKALRFAVVTDKSFPCLYIHLLCFVSNFVFFSCFGRNLFKVDKKYVLKYHFYTFVYRRKKENVMKKLLLSVFFFPALFACSGTEHIVITEKSALSRPVWTSVEKSYPCVFEKEKGYVPVAENGTYICSLNFYSAATDGKTDVFFQVENATAAVRKNLIRKTGQYIADIYKTAAEGSAVSADERKKVLNILSEATDSGVKIGATYWEKAVQEKGSAEQLNCYSLGVIAKAHYMKEFQTKAKSFSKQAKELNWKTMDKAFSGK